MINKGGRIVQRDVAITFLVFRKVIPFENKMKRKDVLNTVYNAGLLTLGAVAASMASKKIFKDDLGVARDSKKLLRMAVAVGGGSLLVKFLQKKDYLPSEPFNKIS